MELNGHAELSVSNCSTIVCVEQQWNRARLYHRFRCCLCPNWHGSELTRAWRVLAGSSVRGLMGPLVFYIKPNGSQIYLYRDEWDQNCLLEVYWTNSCWFRGLRIYACAPSVCLAYDCPCLVVNSALFMMCVINSRIFTMRAHGWWPGTAVNTSRPSLVSSLSTIPEIINVLILLRREREGGRGAF